jgi:hypothetical protein
MITVLVLAAIPAAVAAGFDSVGFGLLAVAGLAWAGALYACSVAPMIVGEKHNGNEAIAAGLSTVAALVALAGIIAMFPLPF